jgi:type I restriction enzyme M protein
MNLAVHGLEGEIRQAISYYEDLHRSTGRFDFAIANPPFNVNAVDKERLEGEVGEGKRYPFGLPRADNANYLWIQLFYSSLNARGRAGFVMANSASDARASEQDIRRKLIESQAVDAIVAVGSNMFYTVTLPVTLWFLDRAKEGTARASQVLFLDARHIYRQVDRAHRDWTPAQIAFLSNIVRLYRAEKPDYTLGGDETRVRIVEAFGSESVYRDVPGLCRAVSIDRLEGNSWSLNPGRYVGVTEGEEVEEGDFRQRMQELRVELEELDGSARELQEVIARKVSEIMES